MSNDRPMQLAMVIAVALTALGLWAILAQWTGDPPCDCECVGEEYDMVGPLPEWKPIGRKAWRPGRTYAD